MKDFSAELKFFTSRSSGSCGQNVNKVETKVELRFNIDESNILSDEEKELLKTNIKNKIIQENIIQIISQSERTQLKNKEICIKKFYKLLEKGLKKTKIRKKTKLSAEAKAKRLEQKKQTSDKKNQKKKRL